MTDNRIGIVFENEKYIVIKKKAGIAVQTSSVSSPDVCSLLKNHLKGGYLGVVHRLDQPVEGLLVFAKDKKTAGRLTEDLSGGRLKKTYKAVCMGELTESGSDICYMKKGSDNRCIIGEGPDYKKAELSYKLIASREGVSLVLITIGTGRFHQIRAQMASLGHPILGDEKYGSPESRQLSEKTGIRFPALCAHRLSLYDEDERKMKDFSMRPENKAFEIFFDRLNDE